MADVFVPFRSEVGLELGWIIDDVAMELAGIKVEIDGTAEDSWLLRLELGPANNQKFNITVNANGGSDERFIPAPQRVPVTFGVRSAFDARGEPRDVGQPQWRVPFQRLIIEQRFTNPVRNSPVVLSVTQTVMPSIGDEHLVAMPATVNVGDLLFNQYITRWEEVHATPSGWTKEAELNGDGGDVTGHTFWIDAIGNEDGDDIDFATSGDFDGTYAIAHVYRIEAGSWSDITCGSAHAADTSSPNPPSHTAPGGAPSSTNLVIATAGQNNDNTVSAYPTSYTNGIDDQVSGELTEGTARLFVSAAAEDPGAFSFSGADASVAWTTIIEEAAGPAIVTGAVAFAPTVTLAATALNIVLGAATFAPVAILTAAGTIIVPGPGIVTGAVAFAPTAVLSPTATVLVLGNSVAFAPTVVLTAAGNVLGIVIDLVGRVYRVWLFSDDLSTSVFSPNFMDQANTGGEWNDGGPNADSDGVVWTVTGAVLAGATTGRYIESIWGHMQHVSDVDWDMV